jgi:soluble lytic murein transglycosylase-like protein
MLVAPSVVRAEVWAYVDEQGQPHFAKEKVDDRYQLFFRGEVAPAAAAQDATPSTSIAEAAGASSAPVNAETTTEPGTLTRWMKRVLDGPNVSRYETLIAKHAKDYQLDPALVKAVIAAESAFEPGAVSPKGALGLMQVLPETAARYGVVGDRKQTAEQKLLDPATNLRAGMRYLHDLLARFGNDLSLTLAAYNAGEGAVQNHRNQVPPYPETREYVKRVQAYYAVFRPRVEPPAAMPVAAHPGKRIQGTFLVQPHDDGSSAPLM